MRAIVLFDLDGTVVTVDERPGPGRFAIDLAIERLWGVADASRGMRFAGGTDIALCRELLQRVGVPDDAIETAIPRLLEGYLAALEQTLATRAYRAVGDVHGSVSALRARQMLVGVATGNVVEAARLKLASAGLDHVFDLRLGGYGSDAERRADLVRVAIDRCRARAPNAPVVVVGDTKQDAEAARAVGAAIVGVGASKSAREELAACGVGEVVDACGAELVEAVERALTIR